MMAVMYENVDVVLAAAVAAAAAGAAAAGAGAASTCILWSVTFNDATTT